MTSAEKLVDDLLRQFNLAWSRGDHASVSVLSVNASMAAVQPGVVLIGQRDDILRLNETLVEVGGSMHRAAIVLRSEKQAANDFARRVRVDLTLAATYASRIEIHTLPTADEARRTYKAPQINVSLTPPSTPKIGDIWIPTGGSKWRVMTSGDEMEALP